MDFDFHQLPVFRDISNESLIMFEKLMETFHCPSGIYVIQQDTPADYLYMVLQGAVEILFKPFDEVPITVSHIEQGGIFGWSAVVGRGKYTSSAIAINELDAVRINGHELRRFCADHPQAGAEILNSLANAVGSRWKDAHEQVKLILEQGMK
jgi:CRP-like cAMP-binding protein